MSETSVDSSPRCSLDPTIHASVVWVESADALGIEVDGDVFRLAEFYVYDPGCNRIGSGGEDNFDALVVHEDGFAAAGSTTSFGS